MARGLRRRKRSERALFVASLGAVAALALPCGSRRAFAGEGEDVGQPQAGQPQAGQPFGGVALEYTAPPECPSRSELVLAIVRRVDPRWLAAGDRRRFVVSIEREKSGYSGTLVVEHPDRERRVRAIHADRCREVSAALAVFVAIALNPVSGDSDEAPSEPSPSPTAESLAAGSHHASPGVTEEPVAVAPSPGGRPPRRGTPAPRGRPSWSWSSSTAVTYLHMPESAWGARVGAQLARNFPESRLSPALRVSWGFADFATFPERAGKVDLRLTTAQLSACGLVALEPAPLTIAPCVGVDVGTLSASAPALPRAGHADAPWRAANAVVRGTWTALPWLSVELEMGALFPFERKAFGLIEPVRIVYRAPPALFASGVGLGVNARFR